MFKSFPTAHSALLRKEARQQENSFSYQADDVEKPEKLNHHIEVM